MQPEGVFYQYPNEEQQFIEGATRWECERSKTPTYLIKIRSFHYSYCPLPNGGSVSESRSVDFELIILGDIINIGLFPAWQNFGSVALGHGYAGYGVIILTDVQVFAGTCEPSTGTPYGTSASWTGQDLPVKVDPSGSNYSPLNGGLCRSKNTHNQLISQKYLGETIGVYPTKTFKVYKGEELVFQREDPQNCPNAWYVRAKCFYPGEIKSRKVLYNNQSRAHLRREFFTYGDMKGVRVYKIAVLGPTKDPNGMQALIGLLTVFSPPNCDLYPKVTTFPGDGGRKCPEGSCTVECDDGYCCYDEAGNLVDSFPKPFRLDTPKADNPDDRQQYISLNYGSPNIGLDSPTNTNYYLNYG